MSDANQQAGGRQSMSLHQVLKTADELREAGRLAEAEHLCRQAVEARPQHAGAAHLYGVIRNQAGDRGGGIEWLKKAVALDPSVALFHTNLGEMCRLAGQPDEAIRWGKRALELKPDYPEALSNLGIAYYDKGDYAEAMRCQEKAVALRPGFAQAHSNLGNALRGLDRLDEAVAAYRRALELQPNFAGAWNNLGTTLRDLHRLAEAEAAYRRALAIAPNSTDALNNLALCLKDLNRLDEAVALLSQSAAIDPNNEKTFVYRASIYLDQNKFAEATADCERALALKRDDADALHMRGRAAFEEGASGQAMAYYRRALEAKPDYADAYNSIGVALKEMGKIAEAREAFAKAIAINPKLTGVYVNLADLVTFTPDSPYLALMERRLPEAANLPETEQLQLGYALAKAYDDLGDKRRSFEQLVRASAMKRRQIEYSEAEAFALFDNLMRHYTPALLKSLGGHGVPQKTPIFIVGMPRSGTTLIEQILASHPAVHGAGELKTLNQLVNEVLGPEGVPERVGLVPPPRLTELGRRYFEHIRSLAPAAERITDKMPPNFFFVGLIHLAMPNAAIIHSMRNPVDTCVSCFSKLFRAPQPYTYDLGELGRYHRKYRALMAHWRKVLPPGRMLEVQYEDVVDDLEMQARRIIAYCGLAWDDACLSFHKTDRPVRTASAAQVRQPIYRSSIGRWRAYGELLNPLLEALGETEGR
jgi:tetratricopeptide (TPR) repeat protein